MFFQKNWHILQDEVLLAVQEFVTGQLNPKEAPDTTLVLIPKKTRPTDLSQL
jgi:hypothetical protein